MTGKLFKLSLILVFIFVLTAVAAIQQGVAQQSTEEAGRKPAPPDLAVLRVVRAVDFDARNRFHRRRIRAATVLR